MVLLNHHDGNRGGLGRLPLDENEATVAFYVFAATTIWCHHTHPTCSHVVGLPVVPPIAVQPVGEGEPYQFVPLVVRQREGAPR